MMAVGRGLLVEWAGVFGVAATMGRAAWRSAWHEDWHCGTMVVHWCSFALGPLVCIGGQMVRIEWRWCKGGMAAAGIMADDGEGYGIDNLSRELPVRRNFWQSAFFERRRRNKTNAGDSQRIWPLGPPERHMQQIFGG